jgi:hypothetical protein
MLHQQFPAASWVFLHPRAVVKNALNLDGETITDLGTRLVVREEREDKILHKRKKGRYYSALRLTYIKFKYGTPAPPVTPREVLP